MANDCLAIIDAAAKGRLSDSDIEQIVKSMQRIQKQRGAAGKLDALESELFDAANELVAEALTAAKIEKRNMLKNRLVEGRLMNKSDDAFEKLGDASLGLESDMVGINSSIEGSRVAVSINARELELEWLGAFTADLKDAGLHGGWARQELDIEIELELGNLRQKNPKAGGVTKSADARTMAGFIKKYQDLSRNRTNRAGSFIRELEGRTVGQTHNRRKLRSAGRDKWKAAVRNRLDWDRMDVLPEDREDFLNSSFGVLSTGIRKEVDGAETDLKLAFKGSGNLGKKASQHRVLHFKTTEDGMAYREEFGNLSFREGFANDLRRAAMNTALMDKFGTNPQAMFERVREALSRKYRDIDPKQVDRLNRKSLDWFMAEIDGSANFASNPSMAGLAAAIRALQSMAKLGGSFLSSIPDIATVAAERRFQGRNLMDSWSDALTNTIEGLAPGDKRIFGDRLGVGLGALDGSILARISGTDELSGRMAKYMAVFFKLNLLQPWTDGVKRGAGLAMARDLGDFSVRSFGALPDQMQRNLGFYGIDEVKWEAARASVTTGPDGKTYMMPSELKGNRLNDDTREALMSYITDRVEFSSPTPGARERALINRGTERGSVIGEVVRFIMQFKSFPITVISRVQGRDIFSGGARSIKDAFLKGEGDLVGLANYIAGSMVLGYFALQAKQLAAGKDFRENSPKTMMAAMLQGGGLGIYGDYLFGETNRFGQDLLSSAAGPTLGTISEAKTVFDSFVKGEDAGAAALRLGKSNLPGANLFYTKAAMDYLIFFQLQEMTNPGFLRRMESRIKSDNKQTFFIPPSSVIPFGGGNRLFEGVR